MDYFDEAALYFGLTSTQLQAVLKVFNYVVSDFLFQGPIAEYTVEELVEGFQASTITDRLNSGSVQAGNLYFRDAITPLYLNQDPKLATAQELSVNTGETSEADVGVIQLENGQTWQNSYYYIWNGEVFYQAIYYDADVGTPNYFGEFNAKMPYQTTPDNTGLTDWVLWDTRFPD